MDEVQSGAVAPVETPVAATEATPQPDTTAVQAETKPDEQTQEERRFTQKEMDEAIQKRLSRESRRLEKHARELAHIEAERDQYRSQLEAREQRNQPPGRPQEKNFEGRPYHEFAAALARWEAKQEFEERFQQMQQQRQEQENFSRVEAMRERIAEGASEFDDFEEVALADNVLISPVMAHAIAESDMPAKLAYYLGQHVDEAARIFKLPATRQVRELGKIEDKLSAPPKTTTAPPPIVPNSTNARVETGYRPDMSDKEFNEWRKRQIAQRR